MNAQAEPQTSLSDASEAAAQAEVFEKPTELELAALLASKICHDIISPVGAVNNGLEVLEEGSEDMKSFAMELISKSASQASAKLQFARIAYGAAGSAGSQIDTGDAQKVAEGYFASEKANISWHGPRIMMGKDNVKLLLNLCLIASAAIPRGGSIDVDFSEQEDGVHFKLVSKGVNARIPNGVEALIEGELSARVDAHSIQPYYAGMLARICDMCVSMSLEGDIVTIQSDPAIKS
jgi:histidine phosphotransferase ChpT